MPTSIETLEEKINMLDKEIDILRRILKGHTHSGMETTGRLEPLTLKANNVEAGNGASGNFTDKNNKVVTVVKGIIESIS